jgi:PKD repeat protein
VKHFGKLPVAQSRFEWDFGDGKKQIVNGDTMVNHTYTTNGTYTIKIKIYKTGINDPIAYTERDIVIGESNSFYLNGNFIDLNGLLTVGTYISINDMTAISVTDQSSKILNLSFQGKSPGIYTIGESGTASISYTTGPFGDPDVAWVVQSGTLTILGYGPVNGKIFGTFSGTLAGVDYRTDPPTELSGTMSNGRFSVYRSIDQ